MGRSVAAGGRGAGGTCGAVSCWERGLRVEHPMFWVESSRPGDCAISGAAAAYCQRVGRFSGGCCGMRGRHVGVRAAENFRIGVELLCAPSSFVILAQPCAKLGKAWGKPGERWAKPGEDSHPRFGPLLCCPAALAAPRLGPSAWL